MTKTMQCGCRWNGRTMRRCARHREAGRLGADILGIPPPDGGNTMKTATRECVVCGGPLAMSGVPYQKGAEDAKGEEEDRGSSNSQR